MRKPTPPESNSPIRSKRYRIATAVLTDGYHRDILDTVISTKPFTDACYVMVYEDIVSPSRNDTAGTAAVQQDRQEWETALVHAGATVFHATARNHMADIRNELLRKIEEKRSEDYVFWVERDERFDWNTLDLLRPFLEKDIDEHYAYAMILRRCLFDNDITLSTLAGMETATTTELDSTQKTDDTVSRTPWNQSPALAEREEETIDVRLFPLHRGIFYEGRVCETLYPSLQETGVTVSAAPGRILVTSPLVNPQLREHVARRTIAMCDAVKNHREPFTDFVRLAQAESLLSLGSLGFVPCLESAQHLLEGIIRDKPCQEVYLLAVYRLYELWQVQRVMTHRFEDSPEGDDVNTVKMTPLDTQLSWMTRAIEDFSKDQQLLLFTATILYRLDQLELAVRTVETALQHGTAMYDVWHRWRSPQSALSYLVQLYHLQNKPEAALRLLEDNAELARQDGYVEKVLHNAAGT